MSFQAGLSGLNAASRNLSVIGNNVANSSTVGFKGARAQFADVFASTIAGSGSAPIGIGVNVADVSQQFTQGNISVTNNPLDIAISGEGFFRVDTNGEGNIQFTRNGQLQLDRDGFLVNSAGHFITGITPDASGQISQNFANPSRIQVTNSEMEPRATGSSSPLPGGEVEIGLNLDSRVTARTAGPTTFPSGGLDSADFDGSTALTLYDSLGNPRVLSLYYVRVENVGWNVYGYLDGEVLNTGTPLTELTFDARGQLTGGDDAAISIVLDTVNNPKLVEDLNFVLSHSGSTQYGSRFAVSKLTQDGYTSGKLTGFSIAPDGTVLGRYSNGQSRPEGRIVLATFPNPQGLAPVGNNNFVETFESNGPVLGEAGTGSLGQIRSGALEDANIDLTQELVNMITAQRAYQANAQTIKTQDAVLQTLVNLR